MVCVQLLVGFGVLEREHNCTSEFYDNPVILSKVEFRVIDGISMVKD